MIYGRRINSLPDEVIEPADVSDTGKEGKCQERFVYLTKQLAHFWERWRKEYLTNLRETHRAIRGRENKEVIQKGDVVTVFEEGKKRNEWKLGVVEELIIGSDKIVR